MLKQMTAAAFLSTSFFLLTGFGEPVHSEVKAQSSVKDKAVELEFKIGLVNNPEKKGEKPVQITPDGPWTLELINTTGLKLETKDGKFVTKAFDPKLSGFKVKAELDGAATAGKVDYMVRAFVCTTDKQTCYTEKHKGSLEWKKS